MKSSQYWSNQLTSHLSEVNPALYQSYINAGEWITFRDLIAQQAQSAYEQLVTHYQQTGSNLKTAEMMADSEVMREYILSVGIESDMMAEEPDEEMDTDYLEFLREV